MNNTSILNRFMAASGTVLLLASACIMGFIASGQIGPMDGRANSSTGLVLQVAGMSILVCFFVAATMSNMNRELVVARERSQSIDRFRK